MSQIVTMPQLGETVTEGTILRWLVKVGDEVKEDDPILEISTDKVDTEVPSPFNGTVSNLLVEEGETVEVGASLLELDGDKTKTNDTPPKEEPKEDNIQDPNPDVDEVQNPNIVKTPKEKQNLQLSPVVRKLASEHNIDLEKVQGTGKNGRIKRQDIEKIISSGQGVISAETIDDPLPQEKEKATLTKESSNSFSRLRK